MISRLKNVLWTILTLVLLACFAAAVPLGSLTYDAQRAYLDIAPADVDDDYSFLFD